MGRTSRERTTDTLEAIERARRRQGSSQCEAVSFPPSGSSERDAAWHAIRGWWQTQHRYATAADLAREIGWDPRQLRRCLKGGQAPPQPVLERLARALRIVTTASPLSKAEAKRRADRLKALLLILHDELAWFRDGPETARAVYPAELNPFDVGYLSSLLAMLGDESRFQRWLAATTNRFGFFRKKGGRR